MPIPHSLMSATMAILVHAATQQEWSPNNDRFPIGQSRVG